MISADHHLGRRNNVASLHANNRGGKKIKRLKFTQIAKNCDQAQQADLILMQQWNITHRPTDHPLQYTQKN